MLFETHKVIYRGVDCEDLIGKEVYFANDLLELNIAVEKDNIGNRGKLLKVDDDTMPFKVQLPSGCETWVKLIYLIPEDDIIVITEDEPSEEPEYRPFENGDELISRWNEINPVTRPQYTMPLIWVRYKTVPNDAHEPTVQMITAFADTGVEMGAEFQSWKALFERMVFLDGTPCGVLK